MAPSNRKKLIIDSKATPGERLIATLLLVWDNNECTFTIKNHTLRTICFDIKYRDKKNKEHEAGEVDIESEGEYTWDPVTNCDDEGHCYVIADGKKDFEVQHYEGKYNTPQKKDKSNYFDGCQYAP
ncbi:hypothetical protein FBU30_002160 [Linnemannia zychae]|nr:hypothetical protein FBU30_002160 [Linnemannia zychae]